MCVAISYIYICKMLLAVSNLKGAPVMLNPAFKKPPPPEEKLFIICFTKCRVSRLSLERNLFKVSFTNAN